ncbi:hypothetical protein B0H13DRAFT_2048820, partial [Mycena leptocephala]
RRSLGGLVPPKIATTKLVAGDSAGPLGPLVATCPAPLPAIRGLKPRFFAGKNASARPALALIGRLFPVRYTMDYQQRHKNHAH